MFDLLNRITLMDIVSHLLVLSFSSILTLIFKDIIVKKLYLLAKKIGTGYFLANPNTKAQAPWGTVIKEMIHIMPEMAKAMNMANAAKDEKKDDKKESGKAKYPPRAFVI